MKVNEAFPFKKAEIRRFQTFTEQKKPNICIDGFDPGYVGVGYLKSTTKTIVLLTLASPPSHTGGRQRKIYFFTHTKPLCVQSIR